MRLSKTEVNDLVKEMNSLVFTKIKENLIKNIERKKYLPSKLQSMKLFLPRRQAGLKN